MVRKTLQDRIHAFESVHKGLYDYSLVEEGIKWDSKINVVCREHGVFQTIVNNHQRGAGCPSCAGVRPLSRDERVAQAVEVHGDKYDYSLWPIKITAGTVVVTTCPDHGEFTHTVANHVNHSSGCPKCAGNIRRTFLEFTAAARRIHGDRYDYETTDDVRNNSDITIHCHHHGEFKQSAGNHLVGKGCPSCGEYGYNPNKPGTLYLIQSRCSKYGKIGITNHLQQRMKQLTNNTPFRWDLVSEYECGGDVARSLEKAFHAVFDSAQFTGFDGATEWLMWEDGMKRCFELLNS